MNKIKFLLCFALLVSGVAVRGQIYINSYRFGAGELILDEFPNAVFGFSFRLLDKDYVGNCIVVRRVNGDTSAIGFVNNYLDTVTLKSFCGTTSSDTCWVRRWYDQSGNTQDVNQTTNANQPTILSGGILLKQGSNVSIRFDGVNDGLVGIKNNPYSFTGPLSIIYATYKNTTSYKDFETILSAGATGNTSFNGRLLIAFSYGNSASLTTKPTITTDVYQPSGIFSNVSIATNERRIVGYYFSNLSTHRSTGLSNVRSNNVDLTMAAYGTENPTALNTNAIRIGHLDTILSSSYFAGDIQEIISYITDRNANRVALESNLNNFYSIY